jgi:hypothetical protein
MDLDFRCVIEYRVFFGAELEMNYFTNRVVWLGDDLMQCIESCALNIVKIPWPYPIVRVQLAVDHKRFTTNYYPENNNCDILEIVNF